MLTEKVVFRGGPLDGRTSEVIAGNPSYHVSFLGDHVYVRTELFDGDGRRYLAHDPEGQVVPESPVEAFIRGCIEGSIELGYRRNMRPIMEPFWRSPAKGESPFRVRYPLSNGGLP